MILTQPRFPGRLAFAAFLWIAAVAFAAPGIITTVAGGGIPGDGQPATQANFDPSPTVLAVDAAGNIYFVQPTSLSFGPALIRKISAAGILTTIAGAGGTGFAGDGGPAYAARFDGPTGIAVDASGNVFISDERNNRVRKIDSAGVITSVATITAPRGIAVDGGTLLVSAGTDVFRISGGVATRVAGNGTSGFSGDGGPATSAQLRKPDGMVPDGLGGFYVADSSASRIRRVDASGTITTVAGRSPSVQGERGVPGPAVNASIPAPHSLARDAAGNLYIGFLVGNQVLVVNGAGTISVAAGTGGFGFSGDGGPATSAELAGSNFIAMDSAGNLYISDVAVARRIRKIDTSGIIRTYAGGGVNSSNGDGGSATSAVLYSPWGVASRPSGDIFITDTLVSRVRRVDASGVITTFAGNGTGGAGPWTAGGPATMASIGQPLGVVVDADGNVLFLAHNRVYKVDSAGTLSTAAGGGTSSADGVPATSASINATDLAVDRFGNLYFTTGYRVRKIDRFGFVFTIAGTGSIAQTPPRHGEGGPATSANIDPRGLAVDEAGNVYISDYPGQVRKVDDAGIITTIAGTGTAGFSGDGGDAASARLSPAGLAFDSAGNLYIADIGNHRIRVVSWQGTISTLAGDGVAGFGGDGGPASAASLSSPGGLFWDPAGFLLIVERGNRRVRKVELADSLPADFAFAPATNVGLSTPVQSAPVTPTDFAAAAAVNVSNGEYSIGCSATFVSSPGTLNPGETICVRHTSSSVNNSSVTTTLVIGGRRATFTSTTVTGPGSVAVDPVSIDFGANSMNTTAPTRMVTLTNTGATPVSVNAVSVTPNFGVSHDCSTLAAGAACTATVGFTPTSHGVLNGTLTFQASPGTQTVPLAGFGERSLTVHYYRSILRRAPEAGGKAFWESEAVRMAGLGANVNETWFAMATSFYFSPEYLGLNRNDTEFLTDLYNTFFNRAPEAGGLGFWTGQLANGLPREVVLVSFMFSPEFSIFTQAIFGNTAARAEVDMVMDFYRGLLSRLPDSAGFDGWIRRFRTAQCSGANAVRAEVEAISREFATSVEYLNRSRTNGQYVGDLYNAFLRRGGDPQSVQFWISKLADGSYTREIERGGFIQSAEFQGRVQRIIQQGCLQ